MINISSQPITLIIGAQNWSAWIESIQIGYGEYEMGSGLMPCTGTINLIFPATYANIPSNPEYRFNAQQWRRGQLVQISVNGAPLPCSGNALKIIKPPQRPNRDQNGIAKMSIEIGCALAYNYFPPEPNDDFSGITAGNSQTYGNIIGSVLSRLGIPSNVNVGNYAINYPLPKIEGNWLDFCGQLADNAGWYLRCDSDGIVVSEYIANAGASSTTYIIGNDESDWAAIGDTGETPIEKLIVTGIKKTLEPVSTEPNVVTEVKTFSEIAPDLPVSQQNPFVLTISKKTTTAKSKAGTMTTMEEIIAEPFYAIAPDLPLSQQNPFVLTISKKTEKKTFFSDGLIIKREETIIEPFSAIAPDLPVSQQNPFLLTISKKTIQSWTKIGEQKYKEIFTEFKPFSAIAPDLPVSQQNPFLLTISNQKTTEGESAPPTDQPISDFTLTEEQIKTEVFAAQLAISDGRERQRTISLPFAVDESQLTAYGQIFNKILVGRAFGWRFATRLNTTLLPMRTVSIIDGLQGYILRMDAMQWAMTQTEAYVVFNGIEDGVFNAATPNDITYPVSFPMQPVEAALNIFGYSSYYVLEFAVELVDATYSTISDIIYASLKTNIRANIDYSTFVYSVLNIFGYSAIATSINLNDKILAYWKFNAKVEREYDEFASTANFVIDEVSDPSVNLALYVGTTFSFITGLIGNCLGNFTDNPVELNTAYGANLTALNPESNGFNFIGIGIWVKTFVSEGLSADQEFGQRVYNFGKFNLSVKVFTNTPLEYYLSIGNSYDSGSPSIDSADLADDIANWNLVIVEINRAALTFSIRINTGTATTLSYTEDLTGFTSGVIGNNTSSDILVAIDEGFAFNAPLTEDDVANIYNSGIGATYPF